uniref:Uncharacterized protein n=1 Tax=Strombidium inclinatum TaxID=197538 RepID=A0A7S3IXY2_9SPIT|mmetsp:Transcript_6047/g.9757  ORF Transcript_6047/g.9757 Transcript_6047/m.9757 type:complete len:104 (+) Transcript_6047:38-349(+)
MKSFVDRNKQQTLDNFEAIKNERALVSKLREAVTFCKHDVGVGHAIVAKELSTEERIDVEKCLVKNYLVPNGWDYFGKRDVIYLDLMSPDHIASQKIQTYVKH